MMEKIAYFNQPNCYRLSNASVELIVTTDLGPRIIRYGFLGEPNTLGEFPDLTTRTTLGDWKPWGGHRLWAAPEDMPGSYAPDNTPVGYEIHGERRICLKQPTDQAGFEKEITVTLSVEGTGVEAYHRITNRNQMAVTVAPWALTIMQGGGVTILPQEPFRPHSEYLLPARPLVLWHFTDLTDPRWTLGAKYLRLRTDSDRPAPQKIGAANHQGWCAYHREGTLFLKRFSYENGATYPDFGANNETFTAGSYMELETLGPLQQLQPSQSAEHVERWYLFRNVSLGESDDSIEAALRPLIAQSV